MVATRETITAITKTAVLRVPISCRQAVRATAIAARRREQRAIRATRIAKTVRAVQAVRPPIVVVAARRAIIRQDLLTRQVAAVRAEEIAVSAVAEVIAAVVAATAAAEAEAVAVQADAKHTLARLLCNDTDKANV